MSFTQPRGPSRLTKQPSLRSLLLATRTRGGRLSRSLLGATRSPVPLRVSWRGHSSEGRTRRTHRSGWLTLGR
jgi:hypothetical protein